MDKKIIFKKILIPVVIAGVFLSILIPFMYKFYTDRFAFSTPVNSQNESTDSSIKNTIVFSYGGLDFRNNIKQQVSQFQKANPDIEVLIQQLPSSSDYQRTLYEAAFSSGDSSVDVINADIIWTAEFASNGWVLPLDSYFSDDMREDFIPTTLEGAMYKGKIYAVPKRTDVPMLYYRKDIVPDPPKTYEEMVALIKKYKNYPGIKYGYVFQGLLYEGLICNSLEFIWNNGGEVLEGDRVIINSPEAVEGLQLLIDLVNSEAGSRDVLNFIEDDARVAFQDGSALFMRNWPFCYEQMSSDSSSVKGRFATAPLPLGPGGRSSSGTLGGWNYMINKNSKNIDAAWKFVEFMTSSETQLFDTLTGGNPPTRKSVYSNKELKESNPVINELEKLIETAKLRPATSNYPRISESMQHNFYNALAGKIDAKTAIENIEKDLNLYMIKK